MNVLDRAHRHLPLKPAEQALWLQLWLACNRERENKVWPEWIEIGRRELEDRVGVTDKTLKVARDALVSRGLIRFKQASRGRWRYRLRNPDQRDKESGPNRKNSDESPPPDRRDHRRNDRKNSDEQDTIGTRDQITEDTPNPPSENFRRSREGKNGGGREASRFAFALRELRTQQEALEKRMSSDELRQLPQPRSWDPDPLIDQTNASRLRQRQKLQVEWDTLERQRQHLMTAQRGQLLTAGEVSA